MFFLDLKRAGHEIYYYLTQSRKEVDFLTKDPLGKWQFYQICYDLSDPQTVARETGALQEAEAELGIKGKIITPEVYSIKNIIQTMY
jgi:hypothetical protein